MQTHQRQIYGQNSIFSWFWGLYSHISGAMNVKFGAGANFHIFNVSVLWGEKPIFGSLSKQNSGWLPVIMGG